MIVTLKHDSQHAVGQVLLDDVQHEPARITRSGVSLAGFREQLDAHILERVKELEIADDMERIWVTLNNGSNNRSIVAGPRDDVELFVNEYIKAKWPGHKLAADGPRLLVVHPLQPGNVVKKMPCRQIVVSEAGELRAYDSESLALSLSETLLR